MKPRAISKELYSEVFAVMTRIKDAALANDEAVQEAGCSQLRSIYDRELSAGRVDPFLTEALADVVDDPEEAVALYRLSLQQAASVPDEPLHSKRLGLARQLQELGEHSAAMAELDAARFDANKLRDSEALAEIAELSRELRPNTALERSRGR
jgi:hypothetical protein